MQWWQFQQTQLARLLTELRRQQRFHQRVQVWIKRYGFPRHDVLAVETERTIVQLREYAANVDEMVRSLDSCQPVSDSWQKQGLQPALKPEFVARVKVEEYGSFGNGLPPPGFVDLSHEEVEKIKSDFAAKMKESGKLWPKRKRKKG